ncbi:MAG: glycosyltransferase family 9 protein [Acidobacteria bacterium]|nr:glycosyltransferase family 9 protein [Acidobacteriota bacterium]
METLFLHPGGLGDTLLSLPAIALMRQHCPFARITLAGNIDHLAAIASGYTDSYLSLSMLPLHRLYAHDPLPESDVRFWRAFDRIISWTGSGDPAFVRNFSAVHPNVLVAAWRPKPGETKHVSQLFIDALGAALPSEAIPTPARIILDPKLCREGEQWLLDHGWNRRDSLIALHPGAGSSAKRWPPSRFIAFGRHLLFAGKYKLVIIEGPAEQALGKQIAQAFSAADTILAESLPLNLLASILGQCGLFVGNDSGITHLAAALGVRAVVLFGPTLPLHWAPLGKDVIVIRDTHGCAGCVAGDSKHTCLENITVEEVLQRSGL